MSFWQTLPEGTGEGCGERGEERVRAGERSAGEWIHASANCIVTITSTSTIAAHVVGTCMVALGSGCSSLLQSKQTHGTDDGDAPRAQPQTDSLDTSFRLTTVSSHHTFYSHPCSLRSLARPQSVLTTCSCSREDRRSPRPYSARPACHPRGRCRATPRGRGRASSQESGCSPVPRSPWPEPAVRSAGGLTPQRRVLRR